MSSLPEGVVVVLDLAVVASYHTPLYVCHDVDVQAVPLLELLSETSNHLHHGCQVAQIHEHQHQHQQQQTTARCIVRECDDGWLRHARFRPPAIHADIIQAASLTALSLSPPIRICSRTLTAHPINCVLLLTCAQY